MELGHAAAAAHEGMPPSERDSRRGLEQGEGGSCVSSGGGGGRLGRFIRGCVGGDSDPQEEDEGPPPTMQGGGGPPVARFFSSMAAEVRIFADSANFTKKHLGT